MLHIAACAESYGSVSPVMHKKRRLLLITQILVDALIDRLTENSHVINMTKCRSLRDKLDENEVEDENTDEENKSDQDDQGDADQPADS